MGRMRQAVFAGAAAAVTQAPAAGSQPSSAPVDPQGRHTFDVRAFGAAGDGKAKDTAAVQKAIDACNDARGGIVYFPPGEYVTGTLVLKSNVTLHLHVSATILGSTQLADHGRSLSEAARRMILEWEDKARAGALRIEP